MKHASLVQRAFRAQYPKQKPPNYTTIKYIVSSFEKTGSVASTSRSRPEPSQKRQDTKNKLETMLAEFPNLSIRKAASSLDVSPTLVYHVLHDDMHLKPYKFHLWHKLEHHGYQKRVDFASWFLQLPPVTKFYLICCDEAYFYLTLPVNKQNNRKWARSQPLEGIEVPLHDKKILVWCAISATKVYGVFYFENSVNQHNYLEMLRDFFWPKQLRTAEYQKHFFLQDGATPHTANTVQTWLKEKFLTKFIDKSPWPPRSPDLNPCDFFLWGYLKGRVYNPLPKTLEDLKVNLEREIKNISKDILKSTFLEFEKRCHLLIAAKGGHIENK